ncbi:putative glycine--tRNA ligase [Teladorsagia circumcincta]|uniref:Putative glycine--tRNA ligase n=1 Tax=Teladorsagia circumcincta TaxID=45464 RepID=A0A2G9UBT7_TELCI|nr:putative glycine--tRNA ligase [Teladorsagia circumcincta]
MPCDDTWLSKERAETAVNKKVGRKTSIPPRFTKKTKLKLSEYLKNMATPEIEAANGAPKIDIDKAVTELKARKKKLEDTMFSFVHCRDGKSPFQLFYVVFRYDFGPMGASGHVDRFADWMVKDVKSGECFRADHLIKNAAEKIIADKKAEEATKSALQDVLARLEGFDDKDMQEVITKFGFKSPTTGNDLTPPIAFNLMFPSQIGPTGDFKVRSYPMVLFSACNQMDGQPAVSMTIGEAVEKGIVANETLGYYMARTHMYLVKVGVDSRRLRFRQHLGNEMAHYAQLVAEKKLDEPRTVNVVEVVPNMAVLGKEFKKDAKRIQIALAQMSEESIESLEKQIQTEAFKLKVDDDEFSLTSNMLSVKRSTKTVHVEEITPSVIEPSFGIGRVMYAVLEHSFRQREGDEQRTFLALRPLVAPIKCSVLPISANERLNPIIEAVCEELNRYELSHRVDDSAGSIGRRYARTDEIGIPFGVTVDFESEKEPWTVTVRHAESMEQIRVDVTELGSLVSALSSERMDWDTAKRMYPIFEAKSD